MSRPAPPAIGPARGCALLHLLSEFRRCGDDGLRPLDGGAGYPDAFGFGGGCLAGFVRWFAWVLCWSSLTLRLYYLTSFEMLVTPELVTTCRLSPPGVRLAPDPILRGLPALRCACLYLCRFAYEIDREGPCRAQVVFWYAQPSVPPFEPGRRGYLGDLGHRPCRAIQDLVGGMNQFSQKCSTASDATGLNQGVQLDENVCGHLYL